MSKERIAWHPAFREAIQAELIDFREVLTFEAEHVLNTEPLKVDVLIIKKPKDAVITKNIGAIFGAVNVVEFKSRTDSISAAGFHKICAYTHLYLSLHNIPATEATMTIILPRHPRNLLGYLKKSCGYGVTEQASGVYYVTGSLFPIQILNINKLSKAENMLLKGLSADVGVDDMEEIFRVQNKLKEKIRLDAYINVIAEANPDVMMEVSKVSKTKITWEQILIESGIAEKVEMKKGFEVAKSMLEYGDSIEKISSVTKIPAEELVNHFGLHSDVPNAMSKGG